MYGVPADTHPTCVKTEADLIPARWGNHSEVDSPLALTQATKERDLHLTRLGYVVVIQCSLG